MCDTVDIYGIIQTDRAGRAERQLVVVRVVYFELVGDLAVDVRGHGQLVLDSVDGVHGLLVDSGPEVDVFVVVCAVGVVVAVAVAVAAFTVTVAAAALGVPLAARVLVLHVVHGDAVTVLQRVGAGPVEQLVRVHVQKHVVHRGLEHRAQHAQRLLQVRRQRCQVGDVLRVRRADLLVQLLESGLDCREVGRQRLVLLQQADLLLRERGRHQGVVDR